MIDWKCIKAAQEELGIQKHTTLEEFRAAWIASFGPPCNERDQAFLDGAGLESFFEDFMTSQDSLAEYLAPMFDGYLPYI